jgi:hypothetical protein
MAKFMAIFHGAFYDELSPEQVQHQMQKWTAWIDKLNAQKRYLSGEPLGKESMKLSGKQGKIVIDGPYIESKEAVAGYIVYEASDLKAAAELARDYPDFDYKGVVTVRPIMKM